MNKHISNKNMAGFIADTLHKRARESVVEHLQVCAQCRSRYDRLHDAMDSQYRHLNADDAVKERVMRSWQELAHEAPADAGLAGLRVLLARRPVAVAASILFTALTVVLVAVLTRVAFDSGRIFLSADRIDAGVTVNGRLSDAPFRIGESSHISLPPETMVRLSYGHRLSIILAGRGGFTLDRLAVNRGSNRIELFAKLTSGILVSRSESGSSMISYAYETPEARIEPVGTEFLLQTAGGKTLVIIRSGAVRIIPAGGTQKRTVQSGFRCLISGNSVETSPAGVEDIQIFENPEKLRSGFYARRLLGQESATVMRTDANPTPAGLAEKRDVNAPGTDTDIVQPGSREKNEALEKSRTRDREQINRDMNRSTIRDLRRSGRSGGMERRMQRR